GAIRIRQARAACADPLAGTKSAKQGIDGSGPHLGIWIEQEDELGAGFGNGLVVGAGKPSIVRVENGRQAARREESGGLRRTQPCSAFVRGGVIDDNHFVGDGGGKVDDAPKAAFEEQTTVPVNNDNGQSY